MEHENENIEEEKSSTQFIDCSSLSIDKLLQLAEENYEKVNINDAEYYFDEALEKDPKNEKVLSSYSDFLMNTEQLDKAEDLLDLALKIYPNTQYYKMFFSLASLKSGEISIKYYSKGISILENLLNYDPKESNDLKSELAVAYSAVAEIFQTDFLHLQQSEQEVLKYIKKSFDTDPNCMDAQLQLTNYYLNKEDDEKTNVELQKLVNGIDGLTQETDNTTDSFKIQVAKLCIETEQFKWPLTLLENLYTQNKDNFEALYLLAFCNFKCKNYSLSIDIMEDLMKRKDEFEQDDSELYVAAIELKNELQKVDLAQENPDEIEDGDGDGDNEDWMDIEEENQ